MRCLSGRIKAPRREYLHGHAQSFLLVAALLVTVATIAFAVTGNTELLVMVSGDDTTIIGSCIGYIGNVVDKSDLAGSAIRSSFVFGWLWLPIVIVYAAFGIRESESASIVDLSRARGVSDLASIVRAFTYRAAAIAVLYLLSSFVAAMIFALKIKAALDSDFCIRLLDWVLANALLLLVQYAETACAVRLFNSPFAGSILALMVTLGGTAFYPSLASSNSALANFLLASPASRFLSSCALSERYLAWGDHIDFCIAALAFICVIDTVVCSIRRRFR